MGDPTRLLSADSDADALERELLQSLRKGPEGDQQAAMWRAVASQLVTAGVVAGASAASSTAAAAVATNTSSQGLLAGAAALLPKALAAKLALVVAVGAAGVGGYAALRAPSSPAAPVPSRSLAAAPVAPPRAPSMPTEQVEPSQVASHVEPRVPARDRTAARPAARPDALAAESRLLTEARAQLRAGDAAAARRTLRTLHSRFARGVLVQEREVLHIELLVDQGQGAEARRRARAFVQAHPESPHSQSLRRLLDAP